MMILIGLVVLLVVIICSMLLIKSMKETKRQEVLRAAIDAVIDRDRMISLEIDRYREQQSRYKRE